MKEITLFGVVLELSDAGFNSRIAGTSAGAIVGAPVAAYQSPPGT